MQAHWIRPNESSRQPNRWVHIATAACEVDDPAGEAAVWAGGVATFDRRATNSAPWRPVSTGVYDTGETMWAAVAGHARVDARTIVIGWRMGEQLRLSRGLEILPELGWKLERWQVGDRFVLLRWRLGKMTLTVVDAAGTIPVIPGQLPGYLPEPRTWATWGDLGQDDPLYRTKIEVSDLRSATLDLLSWQVGADLGNWQPTSGSSAWANWRHQHYTHSVLVHDDEDVRRAEREAAWAGRCEAWKWGKLGATTWTEWDLPLAYPSVCLDRNLPTVLRGRVRNPPATALTGGVRDERWLLRAEVSTSQPVLPARHDGGLLWPVGKFRGWWWDVELAAAAAKGADIRLVDGYRYAAAPALSDWAEWVIRFVGGDDPHYSDLRAAVVKGWGRSLIGRFATRYWAWEDWGTTQVDGIRMDRLADRDTGSEGRWLHVGGRSMVALDMVDGVETAPAVMSAVMAECRIRLWRMIETAGFEHVAYCDTDSVLVDPAGTRALEEAVAGGELWGVRRKSEWQDLEVLGPRQVIAFGQARLSGVPSTAHRVSANTWAGTVTEGLERAVHDGHADRVVRRPRTWKLDGVDRRRVHLDGGRTAPVAVDA